MTSGVLARRVAPGVVDGLCRLAGRRAVVRAARFALHRARLDLPNNFQRNGEARLQKWFLEIVGEGDATVLDVGANVGAWSRSLLDQQQLYAPGAGLSLHVFEPSSDTCELLRAGLPSSVRVNQVAASDRDGTAVLQVVRPGAGTNSLHGPGHQRTAESIEEVVTTTIDSYCAVQELSRIDFLKIDTEGHDLTVFRGAADLLRNQAIGIVQFEYNYRWVYARGFLKDVFDLVEPHGYRVGKVTPRGIEFYPGWAPDLETFVESNYVACAPHLVDSLPSISWWNSAGDARGEPKCTSV